PTTTTTAVATTTTEPTAEPTETEAPTETASPEAPSAEAIEVTGVDYAFEGVPETVEPGTSFTFRNDSAVEVHELILFQIPEGEERSLDELLALPEEEANAIVGEPLGVSVALPGEEGESMMGELT